MALLTLENTIKGNGINQRDLIDFLTNVVTNVNELSTDHATNKTTIDACRVAIIELIDDHATNIAIIADNKTAINAVIAAATADAASNIAGVTVVSSSPAATLGASDPTAGPATLTNTPLTLNGG